MWLSPRFISTVAGLDEGNSPFLKLALEEAIYTVRYAEEGGEIILEGQEEPDGSEQ
jgi:hypothetical protein